MEKPTVIILGGCGFIGRNLVAYLISNDLVRFIRIIDKVPPQVAWLNTSHQEFFSSPLVEFKSANLINLVSCENAFNTSNEVGKWDFIVNCAGETKPGQTDPVYEEGILKLSLNCAKQAALREVKHFVEISSGQMLSSEKEPHAESDENVHPWTFVAKWKRQVEIELKQIKDLNYTILRPAVVYGLGDKNGLMPRMMVAATYKQIGETMKLLWNADMKVNTVHVNDLCKAIWFVCTTNNTTGEIYNVVDDARSTQGTISNLLTELFAVKVDYYGNLLSSAVDLISATDEANDKHLKPWAESCRKDGIQNTPLSPHMDSELLIHKHINLDGNKFKALGFSCNVPRPSVKNLNDIVQDYVTMKVFPSTLA